MIKPKVSIIIPVYNAGAFLHDCVQSLLMQTLYDCEFIFINDGSTDNSLEILQTYQLQDERIILINQTNKGISIARNKGIEISTGTYIGFMDNDDFVKNDMFEKMYNTAVKDDLDILISKTILGRDGKYIDKPSVFPVDIIYDKKFINLNIIPNLLKVEDLFAVWNKIYKRDLVFSNNVRFPNDRSIEEDNMFNIQAFNASNKVKFIEYGGYYYREVATSESRKLIERDYFTKALEKHSFDYKKAYNLSISDEEMNKLKGIRFIQKICYYTYKAGIDNIKFNDKYLYVKNMLFHPVVYEVSLKYKPEILEDKGKLESLILNIIKNKSSIKLYFLLLLLRLLYHKRISELLRYFNNPKLKTPKIVKKV